MMSMKRRMSMMMSIMMMMIMSIMIAFGKEVVE